MGGTTNLQLEPSANRVATLIPALALDWIARDVRPRLLVSDGLDVLWVNDAAKAALAGRQDLEIREGALAATSNGHQEQLVAFVKGVGPDVATLALPCEDSKGHLLLRAQQVGADNDWRHVGVQFYRSYQHVFEYVDFARIFGLTGAEHRVLLSMLDGRTADEISSEKGVSIETVRYQIRQIYEKLDVSSREGLFRRIRPYVL